MCGRFANQLPSEFEGALKDWPGFTSTGYNVAYTQTVPVISDDGMELV